MMNLSSLNGGLCSWTEEVQLENSVIQVHWTNPHASFKITFLYSNSIIIFNYRTPKSRHASGWKICNIFYMIFFFYWLSERFLNYFYQTLKDFYLNYSLVLTCISIPQLLEGLLYIDIGDNCRFFCSKVSDYVVSMTKCIYLVSPRVMFYLLPYSTSNF